MFKNNRGQVRSGWLILMSLIIVFIGQAVFQLPGMTLLSIMTISEDGVNMSLETANAGPWIILLIQGAGTIGGIAATLIAFRTFNKKNPNKLGIQGSFSDLGFGLFLGAASITAIFIILLQTGNIVMHNSFSQPHFTSYTFVFLILFILVGFFEEMFFRGYVINTMHERGNKKWVIYVVSAALFGLVHLTNPNVALFGIINIILVGLLFAYMFDITKSLMLPIGFHITWNYFQGNVFGFAVSGTAPHGLYEIDVTGGKSILTGGAFGLEGGVMATAFIIICFVATYFYSRQRGDVTFDKWPNS